MVYDEIPTSVVWFTMLPISLVINLDSEPLPTFLSNEEIPLKENYLRLKKKY